MPSDCSVLEHGRGPALEGPEPVDRQPDVAGQHLGRLVVADLEEVLDQVGDRGAADRGELGGVGGGRGRGRVALHTHPGVAQGGGEGVGRHRARVVGVAVARRRGAPVDPQRGDRADDVVGHVVGAPPRVVARPGEQGVVVLHPHAGARPQPGGRLARQGHHVGALGVGRRRLLGGQRPAREVGVAAADEHDVAGRGPGDDPRLEPRVGAEGLQRGGAGEQLGRRRRDDRPLAVRPDGPLAVEVAHGRDHVPAEVLVPQPGGEGGGDRRRVDVAARAGGTTVATGAGSVHSGSATPAGGAMAAGSDPGSTDSHGG